MWALIVNGLAAQVTDVDPAGKSHPDLVWVSASAGTHEGDLYDGSTWSKPPLPAAAPAPTLEARLSELAAERYARQAAGVLFKAASAPSASRAASDPVSTGMLTASYVAARDGHWLDGTPWKMSDGSFVALTAAEMQALALKVLGYIAGCFAHEGVLAAALATNLATDITLGWPSPE